MKLKIILAVSLLTAPAAFADPADSAGAPGGTTWGELTSDAIADGFPQGAHSSDPSGDGHGPGTSDEPRSGLANVVGQGDMRATIDLIDNLLN